MAEHVEALLCSHHIKVHRPMCTELYAIVSRVSQIVPEIEAVRPGCSSGIGIDALCLLITELDKANSVLQHCRESSKLYLVLNGDAILSRCKKSSNILERCLGQVREMVHVELALEISGVMADIKRARFRLDPSDQEAGKVLWQLLHQYEKESDSIEEVSLRAIEVACTWLHITSSWAILKEKTSIKKMLRKECDSKKIKILSLFLHLLNKYGKQSMVENGFPSTTGR